MLLYNLTSVYLNLRSLNVITYIFPPCTIASVSCRYQSFQKHSCTSVTFMNDHPLRDGRLSPVSKV